MFYNVSIFVDKGVGVQSFGTSPETLGSWILGHDKLDTHWHMVIYSKVSLKLPVVVLVAVQYASFQSLTVWSSYITRSISFWASFNHSASNVRFWHKSGVQSLLHIDFDSCRLPAFKFWSENLSVEQKYRPKSSDDPETRSSVNGM